VITPFTPAKEYNRLAQIGLRMNNNLDLLMDFSGFTGFFSKMLLISLNGLHALGFGYGWTIIVITLIIKGVFWPLTRASTRSQKRMQALQPQMKAIAEKYKDDPVKKNQKTMDFMKENKVSPLGSCLPTVIQIPVFFGFYYMLRNAIELRGVHFLWAHDLSQPDTVAYLPILGGFPINPSPHHGRDTIVAGAHLPPSPAWNRASKNDALHAPHVRCHVLPDVGWIDPVLDSAEFVEHRPNQHDQGNGRPRRQAGRRRTQEKNVAIHRPDAYAWRCNKL